MQSTTRDMQTSAGVDRVGKIAIVTGAGSGIGAALSRALVARGDTVLFADIDEAAARAVCAEIGNERARPVGLDVRDASAVADLVTSVAAEHGRLDLMVNNAGIGIRGELQEITPEHWDRIIDINLRGVLNGVTAAYPVMLRQRGGHILNMASLAALCPPPVTTPYVMTKSAVVGLSLGMRPEAAAHGISVTVACPGPIDTPFLDKAGPNDLPSTRVSQYRNLRDTFKRAGLFGADDAAREILHGVDRNRAIIVTPRLARVTWRVNRWMPGLVDRLTQKAGGSVLQSLDTASAAAAAKPGSAEQDVVDDEQAGVA